RRRVFSLATPARKSRRSTASRRPGRLRSTASADASSVLAVPATQKCVGCTVKSGRIVVTLRFGTDGVRGVANLDLTPELVTALGRAAARVLSADHVVIGRDTRISGPLLEAALAAGVASEGASVRTLGVVATPVVAWTGAHE